MERARATWTDERLDDMSHRMESGFSHLDADVRALRTDMNSRFDDMSSRFDARFDALTRLLLQLAGGAVVTVVVAVLSFALTRG